MTSVRASITLRPGSRSSGSCSLSTYPDGNQIPEDEQRSDELPSDRQTFRSLRLDGRQIALNPLIGQDPVTDLRVRFAPLKLKKSVTGPDQVAEALAPAAR